MTIPTAPLPGTDNSVIPSSEIIGILRNVTGRVDASDPLFTNSIILNYLNRFLTQQSSQEIRIFKNMTWWEFDIDQDSQNPMPVDLQALSLTTIGAPAYVSSPTQQEIEDNPDDSLPSYSFPLNWYINPAEFYQMWPDRPTPYQPQRPTSVLYYNNSLTFRGPLDKPYHFKIQAYSEEVIISGDAPNYFKNYLYRYAAYGAALDIFSDFGETDKWRDIFPMFQRYRALVYARTYQQYENTRTLPEF